MKKIHYLWISRATRIPHSVDCKIEEFYQTGHVMSDPFVKRSRYNEATLLRRDAFSALMARLEQLQFANQAVILPTQNIKKNTLVAPTPRTLSVPDFLNLDQDFDGIIVRALSTETRDEIVILFRNELEKDIYFADNVFPYSSRNLKSNLYVSTQDPVRTYGLIAYLKDFLGSEVPNQDLKQLLYALTAAAFVTASYLFVKFYNTKPLIAVLAAIGIPLIGLILMFRFYPKRGLRISSAKSVTPYPAYIQKLWENWLTIVVTAMFSVGATLLTLYLSSTFGLKA